MADARSIILHEYPTSPYAEKIRLALRLKNLAYSRVEIPVIMPRPDLMPLTGGYRRTPVLQIGADIFCDTAIILRELEARVRALLRRSHKLTADEVRMGALQLSPFQRTVSLHENRLELPAREYEILEVLAINAPRVVTKARLAQRLSRQGDEVGDNAVEVYVHRLRRRLKDSGLAIRTQRGSGYALEELD